MQPVVQSRCSNALRSNELRILVATDVHLGYKERDEERRMDSFIAFEEVLRLARDRQVDMLLLCGDLFHDQRPSQETLARCVAPAMLRARRPSPRPRMLQNHATAPHILPRR